MKTILHVDANSYFATVAQQANPRLRGKPVGIVKDAGRGCVIAASIEAKKYGVKTGCRVEEAIRLCPGIVLVSADMDKYFSLTKRMVELVSNYSPISEVFSIDELFVDLSPVLNILPAGAVGVAWDIKNKIKEIMGEYISVSVGIGFSKLTAKLASEMKKPDGLVCLTVENCLDMTKNLPVGEVCGIGYAYSKYLHARGAFTLDQARKLDLPQHLSDLVYLRLDQSLTTLVDLQPAKGVSRTFTTFQLIKERESVGKLVRNLIEEMCGKLRSMNMQGRTFGLSLVGQTDTHLPANFWVRKTIKIATCDPLDVYNLVWSKNYKEIDLGVRQVGVYGSNLIAKTQLPMDKRRDMLLQCTDKINDKFGLFTLYPAKLLEAELVRPEVTGYLGDKYYRFNNKTPKILSRQNPGRKTEGLPNSDGVRLREDPPTVRSWVDS